MESQQVEQAVARFIDMITKSADSAKELAQKGVDAGVTFGSELIHQVLVFKGIELGLWAISCLVIGFFLAKFAVKNARLLLRASGKAPLLEIMPDYVEPKRSEVRYVLKNDGSICQVHCIDSEGDAKKIGSGYIWAREIAASFSQGQYSSYLRALKNSDQPEQSILSGIHASTDGIMSTIILMGVSAASFIFLLNGLDDLISVVKIITAPYLYLMEYAVQLKNSM